MKYKLLRDIDLSSNIGKRVFVTFMAKDVEVRLQKDNVTKYIQFNMTDLGISHDVKLFGASESQIEMIENGGVYNSAIDVKPYNRAPCGYSCIVYNIEPSDIDNNVFIEWAEGMEAASASVTRALQYISKTPYWDLVYDVIIEYWDKFTRWTAANSMHHNLMGGLLVHTAEVIDTAELLSDYYNRKYGDKFISKELVLSGALLHDIGKCIELTVDINSGNTEYSTEAALESHIMSALSIIDNQSFKTRFGRQIDIMDELNEEEEPKTEEQIKREKEILMLLKHCIASHHGKKEYGSPIVPNIPEAHIINVMDNLSADMYKYQKKLSEIEAGTSVSSWVGGDIEVVYKESNK